MPNAGSIFRNPPNDSAGRLLEKAGVKGLKEGGAQVWLGHANFIVNIENATSKDVSKLMNKMYNEVKDKYTIKLVPEVKYIGIKSKEEEELWDTMLNKKIDTNAKIAVLMGGPSSEAEISRRRVKMFLKHCKIWATKMQSL